jgi:hypothetical protein
VFVRERERETEKERERGSREGRRDGERERDVCVFTPDLIYYPQRDGKTHSPMYTVPPIKYTDVVSTQSSECGYGWPLYISSDGVDARLDTYTHTVDSGQMNPWWRVNFQRQVC